MASRRRQRKGEGAGRRSSARPEVPADAPEGRVVAHHGVAVLVRFDGSGSSDSDGTIVTYAWSFGDGATGSGQTATHTYADAGAYTPQLTVTDDRGATHTVTGSQITMSKTPAKFSIANRTRST